ncbi:sigma factor-like helix-turn-helix DNA-binding protein [Archangium violaceum]|nr:sigma factor-like helix-turn-helix DNA-binding protein [Archangium violaceum]
MQRHVVTMRMLEKMTGAEVARELSLTPGHAAVLLHRAKAELQR